MDSAIYYAPYIPLYMNAAQTTVKVVPVFPKLSQLLAKILTPAQYTNGFLNALIKELDYALPNGGKDALIVDKLMFVHFRDAPEHGSIDYIRIAFTRDNNNYHVIQIHPHAWQGKFNKHAAMHPEAFHYDQLVEYFKNFPQSMRDGCEKIKHEFGP